MECKFFKSTNNTNAAEFKRCLPLGVQTSFTTMAPAIITAEQLRVKPIIGESLFDAAATYYASNGISGSNTVMNGLVELIQMAVVRLACWDSFAQLAVMMTDAGISNNQGDKRAYRYETDALRETLRRQGYEYINKILEYCNANVATLTQFTASDYYAERNTSLIRTLKEFEKYVSIGGDFCVFARLREWIDAAENMELEFRIGPTLLAGLKSNRSSSTYTTILSGVMAFVAHWAIAEAAPFLNMVPTAHGLMVVSEESGSSQSAGKVQAAASQEQISAYAAKHRQAAERYIGQVVTYCKAHSDAFTSISEIGTESETEHGADIIDNTGRKTFLTL